MDLTRIHHNTTPYALSARLARYFRYDVLQVKRVETGHNHAYSPLTTVHSRHVGSVQTTEIRSRPAWRQTIPRLNSCCWCTWLHGVDSVTIDFVVLLIISRSSFDCFAFLIDLTLRC